MSFTMYLLLIYLILFSVDIFAFIKGKKTGNPAPFIIITSIMLVGIVVLGCLWIASPM